MRNQSNIFLQAKPDFSSFWVAAGRKDILRIEIRFTPQQDVFDLSIERKYAFKHSTTFSFTGKDILTLLHAVVYAIELYSGRYPERTIRCQAGDQIQSGIFRILLQKNHDIIAAMFSIQQEKKSRKSIGAKMESSAFVLKRTLDKQPKAYLVGETLNTFSLLFGTPLYVRFCESPNQ